MSVVLTKENLCSSGTPDTQCFECLRSLTFPYLEWNWNAARPGFAVDLDERHACAGPRSVGWGARKHIDELSRKYVGSDYRNPVGPQGRVILKIAADKVNTPATVRRR